MQICDAGKFTLGACDTSGNTEMPHIRPQGRSGRHMRWFRGPQGTKPLREQRFGAGEGSYSIIARRLLRHATRAARPIPISARVPGSGASL